MKPKTAVLLNLVVSILFAIGILAAAFWMGDSESKSTVTFLIIAAWWIPFSYFIGKISQTKCCNKSF